MDSFFIAMPKPENVSNSKDLILLIAGGEFPDLELDKGGNWSAEHGVWVDCQFKEHFDKLSPEDRKMAEVLGEVGLSVARIFREQIVDAQEGVMWPNEVFEAGGGEKVIQADKLNQAICDPYLVLSRGFDFKGEPYSHRYADELEVLSGALSKILEMKDNETALAVSGYVQALVSAYNYDHARESDFVEMWKVDRAWVDIPSDSNILIFAEPTEVYQDPARVHFSRDSDIKEWAKQVTERQDIGPWRNFFEFRLLVKDESMVTQEEVEEIRQVSGDLFGGESAGEVEVSLEFRRMLMASGNGAHPAKTAKNYPNFVDIREKVGYKNVLYTNMIEEGVVGIIKPGLVEAFGEEILAGITDKQLIRGSALRVVAHEENHPFRRIDSDQVLEELKSSVNGTVAMMGSASFSKEDIESMILTQIGAALHVRSLIVEAREKGDKQTQIGMDDYYQAYTILLNYMVEKGLLVLGEDGKIKGVGFEQAFETFTTMSEMLEGARIGDVAQNIVEIYEECCDEVVWERF